MPEIVDLRDLVPDDIVFVLPGDREYRIPGDIDVDNAFRLLKLLVDLTESQAVEAAAKRRVDRTAADSEATVDEIEDAEAELAEALEQSGAGAERAGEELRRVLLELLQIRQPDLDRLPFGIVACQHVTGELLRRIGLLTDDAPAEAAAAESGRDPTRRRPNAARSGRSSGSTRSSTSSASTRKR